MLIEIKRQSGKRSETNNEELALLYWATVVFKAGSIDKRPHATHVLIDDNRAVCTDGNRMHVVELNREYKPGLYRVFKRAKTHMILFLTDIDPAVKYPQYKSMFEVIERKDSKSIPVLNFIDPIESSGAYARIIRETKVVAFNFGFLSDLNGIFDGYFDGPEKLAAFVDCKKTAFIMPLIG